MIEEYSKTLDSLSRAEPARQTIRYGLQQPRLRALQGQSTHFVSETKPASQGILARFSRVAAVMRRCVNPFRLQSDRHMRPPGRGALNESLRFHLPQHL